jgi:serine/threonine protein kinase
VIKGDTIDVTDLNKVDLYSFGVILYYFAFGYYPFNLTKEDAKQNAKIYEKITKELIIENEDNYYSTHFIDFVSNSKSLFLHFIKYFALLIFLLITLFNIS